MEMVGVNDLTVGMLMYILALSVTFGIGLCANLKTVTDYLAAFTPTINNYMWQGPDQDVHFAIILWYVAKIIPIFRN